MTRLSQAVLSALQTVVFSGNEIKIVEQLSHEVFDVVKEVTKRLRAKYKVGSRFVFPYSPETTRALIESVIKTESMPDKNPLAFFPTPKSVVDSMLEYISEYLNVSKILEPSAGLGAIAKAAKEKFPDAELDIVELDPLNIEILQALGFSPIHKDFLRFVPTEKYDLILMNPPFRVAGDATAYITHIKHAYKMLESDGQLISILPDNPNFEFVNWVNLHGYFFELPKNCFAESGTNLDVRGLVITQDDLEYRKKPHQEYSNLDTFLAATYANNEFSFYQWAIKSKHPLSLFITELNKLLEEKVRKGEGLLFEIINYSEVYESFYSE